MGYRRQILSALSYRRRMEMSKPFVAIVGRPNVGKSTLLNGLAQRRVSIVEDIPGVTRDRIYCNVRWLDKEFTMIDTGGINSNRLMVSMAARGCEQHGKQTSFCCSGRKLALQDDIANMLRTGRPSNGAISKVDGENTE